MKETDPKLFNGSIYIYTIYLKYVSFVLIIPYGSLYTVVNIWSGSKKLIKVVQRQERLLFWF